MKHLAVAQNDQKYVQFVEKKLSTLNNELEKSKKDAAGKLDADLVQHYE